MTDCASASRNPTARTAAGFSNFAAGKNAMNAFTASGFPARRFARSVFASDRRYSRLGREGRDFEDLFTANLHARARGPQPGSTKVLTGINDVAEGGLDP